MKHGFRLALTAVLALSGTAEAATYYVASSGSDTNSCSSASPCKSFSRAYQVASGGDVVEVAAGTYSGTTLSSLTPKSSTVTFRPASGATVTLQGGLTLAGVSRLEFDDFNLTGAWDVEDSNNIVFRRVKVTSGTGSSGAFIRNTQNSSFYDCEIGNIDPGDGLELWPSSNGNNDTLLFDGLWIHDLTRNNDPTYHQDGVQMISGNNVRFNRLRMYNVSTQGFYTQPDISPGTITNLTVENSWLGKIPEGYYAMQLRMSGNNFIIRNNTFTDAVYSQDVSGVHFVGNFFAGFAGNSYACQVLKSNSAEFANNVINEACPGADSTNKIAMGSRTSLVNPDPTTSAAYDLHLKSGSPAIDAGSPTNYPSADYDGSARPVGARADAGAHEYGGTGGTAPPTDPPPPQNPPPTPPPTSPTDYSSWSNGPSSDPNYFPIGVWLQSPGNIQEYKNIGINTFVGFYGSLDQTSLSQYATAQMPLIAQQNSVGLTSAQRAWLKGWAQVDEPDNAQPNGSGGYDPCITPSTVVSAYNTIRANDTTRPVFLNFGRGASDVNWGGRGTCTGDTSYYQQVASGGDILSFDIYPVANYNGQLELVAKGVDNLKTWSNNSKIIWNFVEGVSLDGVNVPTAAQVKAEVWMSLIHGSRGIAYFVHQLAPTFREDGIFNYPALVQGVTAINSQIASLAPVLNSTPISNGVQTVTAPSSIPVDTAVRQYGGSTYVFAAGMRNSSTNATFTIPGMQSGIVDVLGESRQLAVSNGQFQDSFAGYAVHLYKATASSGPSPCDVNRDGFVNQTDVSLMINQALGAASCTADLNKDGHCNVVDVQRVINASLVGGVCVSQ